MHIICVSNSACKLFNLRTSARVHASSFVYRPEGPQSYELMIIIILIVYISKRVGVCVCVCVCVCVNV